MIANAIVPFNAQAAVEMVKQLRLAVDILRGSGELVAGLDYGKIPGTGDKDTLLLPGMEKLCRALNAVPEYVELHVERDYSTPRFHYEYQCTLRDADSGTLIPGGRGMGLCNSMESGFAWRWVQAFDIPPALTGEKLVKRGGKTSEFAFAIDKAETGGKYGKPAEYWQMFKDAIAAGTAVVGERDTSRGKSKTWEIDTTVYRIPNPDVFDQVNAIMKRAKKRALGDAIKGAANVSAYFTVDMEDFVPGTAVDPDVVEGTFTVKSKEKSHGNASGNGNARVDARWANVGDEWAIFVKSAHDRFKINEDEVKGALNIFNGLELYSEQEGMLDWEHSRGWATAAIVAFACGYEKARIEEYTSTQQPAEKWVELNDMALKVAAAVEARPDPFDTI